MALSFGRLVRRWSGALLALLGLGLLAPDAARAGCNTRGTHTAMGAAHFDRLGALGSLDGPGALPVDGPSPCANGACSKGRPAPLAPPAADAPAAPQWAMLGELLTPSPPADGRSRPLDADDRRPIDLGPAIFHPPRRG